MLPGRNLLPRSARIVTAAWVFLRPAESRVGAEAAGGRGFSLAASAPKSCVARRRRCSRRRSSGAGNGVGREDSPRRFYVTCFGVLARSDFGVPDRRATTSTRTRDAGETTVATGSVGYQLKNHDREEPRPARRPGTGCSPRSLLAESRAARPPPFSMAKSWPANPGANSRYCSTSNAAMPPADFSPAARHRGGR